MRMIMVQDSTFDDFFKDALTEFRIQRGKIENEAGRNKKVTDAVADLHEKYANILMVLKRRIETSK